jgi:hypothetical protein
MMSLLLLTLAVAGVDSGTAGGATAAPKKPAKERLVCRTQERLGTRLGGKRVCNTKAEWAEIEAQSGAAVREFQRTASSLPTNGT